MIYSKNNLPSQVLQLNTHLQSVWFTAYELACQKSENEILSSKVAWKVVRDIVNNPIHSFSLYITKANIDKDGRKQFLATASDINPDVFSERMSIPLFKGFISRFTGNEFVSLAHYPRLKNGSAEVGLITKIYLDGEYLKVKGFFHDTQLGNECYQSIVRDRELNLPDEKRVRVSIGFYDRKHIHEKSGYEWKYEMDKPCYKCLSGKTSDKIYLEGILDHVALTRIPANRRTDISPTEENNL